jgi:hypothetical protein
VADQGTVSTAELDRTHDEVTEWAESHEILSS